MRLAYCCESVFSASRIVVSASLVERTGLVSKRSSSISKFKVDERERRSEKVLNSSLAVAGKGVSRWREQVKTARRSCILLPSITERDFEMEQKIELEIRLRELAAQSMLDAQTEIDLLEVEKSLLASDQRMNHYASELEQLRKKLSNPSLSTDSGRGSKSNHTNRQHHRSDVIGATGATEHLTIGGSSTSTGSPTFSSNSQSPSKLSPVSGQSANSPNSLASSQHSRGYGLVTNTTGVGGGGGGGAISSTSAANQKGNTLNSKQRAKLKRRELLMQSITSLSNINCNMVNDNRASVSLSELRIPLIWRDIDQFSKGKGDYKRFAVFCLLKIDSQIYDTQLITDVDRQVTDITFDETIVFHNIEPNFELVLEVYSCVYVEHFSFSSTPRRLKEKLTSSVSRAMGRRMATQTASTNYTKELQAYDKSYRFSRIATATFRMDDAADCVRTHDLSMAPTCNESSLGMGAPRNGHSYYNTIAGRGDPSRAPPSNHYSNHTGGTGLDSSTLSKDARKNTLPLFGHICCKLLVMPNVLDKCIKTGYLRVATFDLMTGNLSDTTLASSGRGSESPTSSSASGGNGGNGPASGDDLDGAAASADFNTSNSRLKSALAVSTKMASTLTSSSSSVYWAILRNFTLYLWLVDERRLEAAMIRGEQPQLETTYKPRFTFRIDKFTRLLRVSNSSLTIETGNCCLVLGAYAYHDVDRSHEIGSWLRAIEQHIYDSHIWGSVLNHDQHLHPHKWRGVPTIGDHDRVHANTLASPISLAKNSTYNNIKCSFNSGSSSGVSNNNIINGNSSSAASNLNNNMTSRLAEFHHWSNMRSITDDIDKQTISASSRSREYR